MTEAEKNEIVGLVMTEISSQAVDFDITTEQPQANDLLTAVRQTSSGAYVGVTIKWDDVARIATELANQAATRAEQAKTNVENMKSSVEQTVTDFNALAEEKKQEVQGVYQSDLNELKGDIVKLNGGELKILIKWNDHGYVDTSNGSIAYDEAWKYTDFIEIPNGISVLNFTTDEININYNAFYDSAKNYLKRFSIASEVEVPSNVKYIRCSISSSKTLTIDNELINSIADIKAEISDIKQEISGLDNKKNGIYYDGSAYTHFTKVNIGQYLCRKFERFSINNLLDLSEIFIGHIVDGVIVKDKLLGSMSSDTVGPIGVAKEYVGSMNWSGGVHGINGHATAEQTFISVKCDGNSITESGIYFGNVEIITHNNIYFPQDITSDTLPTDSKYMTEIRTYTLDEKMTVRVVYKFEKDCYVGLYGCQIFPCQMDRVYLPNAEKEILFADLDTRAENYELKVKEPILIFSDNNGNNYDVEVKQFGLGTMSHSTKGYGLITSKNAVGGNANNKCYFYLCTVDNAIDRLHVEVGSLLCWEAIYNMRLFN